MTQQEIDNDQAGFLMEIIPQLSENTRKILFEEKKEDLEKPLMTAEFIIFDASA
jgi:hypothetical protein